jgi:hypothetical protein
MRRRTIWLSSPARAGIRSQTTLEREEHHEIDGPYVIVQRDFEMPDDGRSSASLQSP